MQNKGKIWFCLNIYLLSVCFFVLFGCHLYVSRWFSDQLCATFSSFALWGGGRGGGGVAWHGVLYPPVEQTF